MTLIAAGLVNVDGDIEDVVRAVTCPAEASVGVGTTISDGGLSRYIAECAEAVVAGNRIDLGAIPFDTSFTWVVRFVYRAGSGDSNYHNLMSRGGVFNNSTQKVIGWRVSSTSAFQYRRNSGGTFYGSEGGGALLLTAGQAYTVLYRYGGGSNQLYYIGQDIGGAGVDYVLIESDTNVNHGSDGAQNVYLAGPAAWVHAQEDGINAGILGVLVYDHRVDDTELAAIALDGATGFYDQIPSGGPTYVLECQPGALALSGTDATLVHGRRLEAQPGALALTGTDAGLLHGRRLEAQPGSLAFAGTNAALAHGRVLVAQAGALALTGANATLLHGRVLEAQPGALVITGTDATLTLNPASGPTYVLECEPGSLALVGTDAGLLLGRRLEALAGALAFTGSTAGLQYGRRLVATPGVLAFTGAPATLLLGRRLEALPGVLLFTGTDALLFYSGALLVPLPEGPLLASLHIRPGAGSLLIRAGDAAIRTRVGSASLRN